jgi:hypothetical protein
MFVNMFTVSSMKPVRREQPERRRDDRGDHGRAGRDQQ